MLPLRFVLDELEAFPLPPASSSPRSPPTRTASSRPAPIPSLRRPRATFELCVNRVENGFFSNHLADLPDLPPGGNSDARVRTATSCSRSPSRIPSSSRPAPASHPCAPSRNGSFPRTAPTAATAKISGWSTARATKPSIYYHDEFEALCRTQAQLPLPAHAKPRAAPSGPACAATCRSTSPKSSRSAPRAWARPCPGASRRSGNTRPRNCASTSTPTSAGLNIMVSSVRDRLAGFGWHKKQIIFERYD